MLLDYHWLQPAVLIVSEIWQNLRIEILVSLYTCSCICIICLCLEVPQRSEKGFTSIANVSYLIYQWQLHVNWHVFLSLRLPLTVVWQWMTRCRRLSPMCMLPGISVMPAGSRPLYGYRYSMVTVYICLCVGGGGRQLWIQVYCMCCVCMWGGGEGGCWEYLSCRLGSLCSGYKYVGWGI